MRNSCRIFNLLTQDHHDLSREVSQVCDNSLSLKHKKKIIDDVHPKIIQNCHFEKKIIHEFMRDHDESEFQFMADIEDKMQDHLIFLLEEIHNYRFIPTLWIEKSVEFSKVLDEHFDDVEKSVFTCLNYYMNKKIDDEMYAKYLFELEKNSSLMRVSHD